MRIEPCLLYLGTNDGMRVLLVDENCAVHLVGQGLYGNAVRGITVHPENPQIAYIGCGLRGWGLHLTKDAGQTFQSIGFEDQWVWDVAFHPCNPDIIWVGTEPPMIHVSRDGGNTYAQFNLEQLPSAKKWHFFHPPFYAGHIHGITIDPAHPARIYAGIEQGGLIFSHDSGQTWRDALTGKDLHRIAIDQDDPNHILAGAGEGLFVTRDAGLHWNVVTSLQGKYIHSVIQAPHNTRRWYVYADDANCPIYRSDDGGDTWQYIGRGLPPSQPADTLVHHPTMPNVLIYAGDTSARDSSLFLSVDAGEHWECILDSLPKAWRIRMAVVSEGFRRLALLNRKPT